MTKEIKDLTGQVFGDLTVVGISSRGKWEPRWKCLCACGGETVRGTKILQKESLRKDCGHSRNKYRSHGQCQNRTWYSWQSMKSRCNYSKRKDWKYYGGRGIKYDPNWETFEAFYKDMGDRPEGKTLDRIDTDGMYCKANCKWSTPTEQMRNRRKVEIPDNSGNSLI